MTCAGLLEIRRALLARGRIGHVAEVHGGAAGQRIEEGDEADAGVRA